jgi:heterodisulfide reductase subunit A
MEELRIGVYICWCGTNISKMVDVEAASQEIGKLPNVTSICVPIPDRT